MELLNVSLNSRSIAPYAQEQFIKIRIPPSSCDPCACWNRMILRIFLLIWLSEITYSSSSSGLDPLLVTGGVKRWRREADQEIDESNEEDEDEMAPLADILFTRMKDEVKEKKAKKKIPKANVYMIPGPQEPLPGRSHIGNYWPIFPFQNQFSGGVDLDTSNARHLGLDTNVAIPSWGIMDMYGRIYTRIRDTTTKFGYINHPVNMLDLDKNDYIRLMTDPSLHWNRNGHPTLPLGKVPRTYTPISCKPPMCNPYEHTFAFGLEHDYGLLDGVEGDIDAVFPISKGVAYRVPVSGKIYYIPDNITVTYGQNLGPIDPLHSLFDYQYTRDPNLAIPRNRRSSSEKVYKVEPQAKTFSEYLNEKSDTTSKNRYHSKMDSKASSIPSAPSLPWYYGMDILPNTAYNRYSKPQPTFYPFNYYGYDLVAEPNFYEEPGASYHPYSPKDYFAYY